MILHDDDAALAWARDELAALVQIPSFSGEEHAIVDHLQARCEALDLPVRRLGVDGAADDLVVGGNERPSLLLTAHVDTIRPSWPWEPSVRVDGDRLYGLGAQDDGGSVVAALLALVLARESGVALEALPAAVGLCTDEEVGGRGSMAMAEALRPRWVVGLEGTELGLGLCEGGFVDAYYTVRGVSVHGALREEGDNAIEKAGRLIAAIHDARFTRVEHPVLGRNIPATISFHAGSDLNIVPDEARLRIDVRVVPGSSAAEVHEHLTKLAAEFDADLDLVEPPVEPFETSPEDPLALALSASIERTTGRRPPQTGLVPWTDAHNFVDLAGSTAVTFGPGHLRDAHRPDESVDLREVVTAARVLADLLTHVGETMMS